MKKHLSKVVIITGISGGIGQRTANFLYEKGYKIYGIMRGEFSDERFTCYKADVNDYQKIKEIFEDIYQKEKRIDVLINNAGFGIAGAIENTPPEKIYQILNTNLSAVISLMSLAIPYLKESKGNIINISSVGGIIPLPYQACYSASKAGMEIVSRAIDGEVKSQGVKTTVILPGDLNTSFTSARVKFTGQDKDTKEKENHSIKKMENFEKKGSDPIVVSKAIYKILGQKRPPLRKTVGFGNKLLVFLVRLLPTRFINFLVRHIYC